MFCNSATQKSSSQQSSAIFPNQDVSSDGSNQPAQRDQAASLSARRPVLVTSVKLAGCVLAGAGVSAAIVVPMLFKGHAVYQQCSIPYCHNLFPNDYDACLSASRSWQATFTGITYNYSDYAYDYCASASTWVSVGAAVGAVAGAATTAISGLYTLYPWMKEHAESLNPNTENVNP